MRCRTTITFVTLNTKSKISDYFLSHNLLPSLHRSLKIKNKNRLKLQNESIRNLLPIGPVGGNNGGIIIIGGGIIVFGGYCAPGQPGGGPCCIF